jgi:hypothetical protein
VGVESGEKHSRNSGVWVENTCVKFMGKIVKKEVTFPTAILILKSTHSFAQNF